MSDLDMTPRYAPSTDLFNTPTGFRYLPVSQYLIHPPGNHPKDCPIVDTWTVLELRADGAIRSRWYGIHHGYINSEMRMVVVGINPRDEVRMKWEPCQNA